MKPSIIVAALLALAGLTLVHVVESQTPSRPAAPSGPITTAVGPYGPRYQIVNPTPESRINYMLLDTVTGDTWITCTQKTAASQSMEGWCKMFRVDAPSARPF